jgi:hypothetical protein
LVIVQVETKAIMLAEGGMVVEAVCAVLLLIAKMKIECCRMLRQNLYLLKCWHH